MAGDWIKIETALPQKSEVLRIGRILGISPDAACGVLIRFWSWFGCNSSDGKVTQIALRDCDMIVTLPGFADALVAVGWLVERPEINGIEIPNFDRHNGESSKKRALSAKRQANYRNAISVTKITQSALPEKRREDSKPIALNGVFREFWAMYPKKVGKGAAEAAWARVNPDAELSAKILNAIQAARNCPDWNRDNGQFIPHPSTWLNQKRWEDEPDQRQEPQKARLS